MNDADLEMFVYDYIESKEFNSGEDLERIMMNMGEVITNAFCDIANDNDYDFTPAF